MSRQAVLIGIALVAVLAGVVAIVWWPSGDEGAAETEVVPEPENGDEAVRAEQTWTADLYFPGVSGLLHAEPREVPHSAVVSERIQAVVATLLAGPQGPSLRSPLPAGVAVREVYVTPDGVVYLDLESVEGAPPPASGSSREMLTIYSLVNTVLLNVDDVSQLVLLWNGRQLKTFAGHVDTRRPLAANSDLVAQP